MDALTTEFPACDPPAEFPRHFFRPGDTECGCRTLRRPSADVGEVTVFQPLARTDTPDPLGDALNSGDGTYRP